MIGVWTQLIGLISAGAVFGAAFGGGDREISYAEAIRARIARVVLRYLLPALVLRALAGAPLGTQTWGVPLVSALSCLWAAGWAWLIYDRFLLERGLISREGAGAMLLASAWSNVTYLGIPIITGLLGPGVAQVAVLSDFLALTPLLLTVGVAIGTRYGEADATHHPGPAGLLAGLARSLARLPPLWAAALGLGLRAANVSLPLWLEQLCKWASLAVAPLMLFSLGLALKLRRVERIRLVLPAVGIKLLLAPLLATWLTPQVGLTGDVARAAILETAMPSMLLPLTISDRHRLDSELLALAVAVSTLFSFGILQLWR